VTIVARGFKQNLQKYYAGFWFGFNASLIIVLLWFIFVSVIIYNLEHMPQGGFARM